MNQTIMNINIDYNDMMLFENFCKSKGTNVSAVIGNFIKNILHEQKLSFDDIDDPFYSDVNMSVLRRSIEAAEAGNVTQHDLIEV